jgi:phage N-6-adenine-methyltransferase
LTYYQLAKQTGRHHDSLKKWHIVYRDTPTRSEYLKIAKDIAEKQKQKWLSTQNKSWYQLTESIEWETPQWLFDRLDEEFHFERDVCATKDNAKCANFWTKEDNALEKEWEGVCWMNPPYGTEIKHWMAKAKKSSENGATVVCLVPARPDTDWWWDNVLDGQIRFLHGRLKWPQSETMAPFPSAVIVLGTTDEGVIWWNIKQEEK